MIPILKFLTTGSVAIDESNGFSSLWILAIGLAAGVFFLGTKMFSKWFGYSREEAFLLTVGTLALAVAFGFWEFIRPGQGGFSEEYLKAVFFMTACRIVLVLLGVPFVLKIYSAWIGTRATPAEKSSGVEGLRAWLSPVNLIFATLIACFAVGGYDSQFLGIFTLLIGGLVVQPVVATLSASSPTQEPDDGLSAEREKILSLLEVGTITADESADLLNALGSSAQPSFSASGICLSPHRRVVFLGAGLLLISFFLPWFSIDAKKQMMQISNVMQRVMEEEPNAMNGYELLRSNPRVLEFQNLKSSSYHLSGGDLSHGSGWLVLLLGIGAAVSPFVARELDAYTQRTISMVGLCIGGVVLIFLITQHFDYINIGLPLALIGLVLEFAGILNSKSNIIQTQRSEIESAR